MEDRGLHLHEPPLGEDLPERAEQSGPDFDQPPALQVRCKLEVAPAEAELRVAQPVPLLGERAQRFGQQGQAFDLDRELTPLGLHDLTLGPDDVAEVQEVHHLVALLQGVPGQEQLEVPGRIAKRDEREFPVLTQEDHPAGHGGPLPALFSRLEIVELRMEARRIRVLVETQRERFDTLVPQAFQALAAGPEDLRQPPSALPLALTHPAPCSSRR